jgi:hypothetical protein
VIRLTFLILEQEREAFVKPLEYVNVGKVSIFLLAFLSTVAWLLDIPLSKPCCCHSSQLCLDSPEILRAITYYDDCFLHCAPGDVCRPIDEGVGIQLSCTGNPKETCCRAIVRGFPP